MSRQIKDASNTKTNLDLIGTDYLPGQTAAGGAGSSYKLSFSSLLTWIAANLSASSIISGVLSASRGGTGKDVATLTVGDLLQVVDAGGGSKAIAAMSAYIRTAEEIAAGVTPTDYAYPPGDVRRYGENISPGVTDMSTAVASAILSGYDVEFPNEDVLCGEMTASTPGQRFFSKGQNAVITPITTTQHQFIVSADNVTFENLRFNGVETIEAAGKYAIFTESAAPAKWLTVRDCTISGASAGEGWANGIKFDAGSDWGYVTGCTIERLVGQTSGYGYGVLTGAVTACRVVCNVLIGSSGRGRHAIYFSAGADDCIADGNYIADFDWDGISQFAQGAQPLCERNQYTNNRVINCVAAGNVTSGGISIHGKSADALIDGNIISGSGAKGISVDGTNYTTLTNTRVVNNTVINSALVGIDFIAAVGGQIVGNTVRESSYGAAGVSSNIALFSDGTTKTSEILVAGNHSSGSTYARSPFQINGTAPISTNITVRGNYFPSCQLTIAEFNVGGNTPADTDLSDEVVVNTATPSIAGYNNFLLSNGGATNVTAFANPVEGQTIRVRFADGNSTVVASGTIKLAGGANFVGTADDVLTLQYRGAAWYELASSVNA